MRKIALVTTSRADYGIQSRLVRMLQECGNVKFSLVVSGTHLSEKHGMTICEIERDGIDVAARVDIGIDSESDVSHIMAKAITCFADALSSIRPNICVLLGDRYEMLSAAIACTLCNIPIAHIHGGETTQGAYDEAFRHSITKMSHLHFTSCEAYRKRVIQLGEHPQRVLNVGSLGVENIHQINLMTRNELENDLGVTFRRRNLLVTFHPATHDKGMAGRQTDELLAALDTLDDVTVVFTRPNADAEGDEIAFRMSEFVASHGNAYMFASLGARRYLSLAGCVDAVVGNSSSGIVEIPSLGTATVNIGDRQEGRIRAPSVIDCKSERSDITEAICRAMDIEWRRKCLSSISNPYDKPETAKAIVSTLLSTDLGGILKKRFYDMEVT